MPGTQQQGPKPVQKKKKSEVTQFSASDKPQQTASGPPPATQAFTPPVGGTYPSASAMTNPQPAAQAGAQAQSNPITPEGGLNGFAKDYYSSVDLNQEFWDNPWSIADFAMQDRGRGNDRSLIAGLRDIAPAGLPIFTMLNGLTNDPTAAGDSSATINYIAQLLNSMSQRGGNVPGYQQLLGQLLQGRAPSDGNTGNETILSRALNGDDTTTNTDQVNTFMTYLRSALGTNSLNPITGSAVLSQANQQGRDFQKASMGGQDGYGRNFTDWINSGGNRLFGDPNL